MSTNPKAELEEKLKAYIGIDIGPAWIAQVKVNDAMIHHYCAVMGDRNPVYFDPEVARDSVHNGIVAPPTTLDIWSMPGLTPPWVGSEGEAQDKQVELHRLLDSYGYTGVVGTNYDQEYVRYLRLGDDLTCTIVIDTISEEKATPLGLGYFITTLWTFRDQDGEVVGRMSFRVLKFKPQQQAAQASPETAASAKATRMRPPMGHDNAWWWEAIQKGELRIQKCKSCGVLRHPPRPMCGECQSVEWESVRSNGEGTIYSHTILHHPKFPGFDYPVICALIELREGTRIVSNIVGCADSDVHIGMPVRVSIENVDDEMKLPLFRPVK